MHEKSILLPMLPATLLFIHVPLLSMWMNLIATFTMFPLLLRDGLAIPYGICMVAFIVLTIDMKNKKWSIQTKDLPFGYSKNGNPNWILWNCFVVRER